jgi:hypothetical protein
VRGNDDAFLYLKQRSYLLKHDFMNIEKSIDDQVRKHPSIERFVSLLKAGGNLHPVVGSIVSLVTDYIPSQRQVRFEDFTKAIAADLERFKDEINDDYINTDEFAFIFEKCFKGAVENYQKEKFDAFRAVFINSLCAKNINQNEKEFFLSMIDRLSVTHIRVLSFIADPHRYLEDRGISASIVQGSYGQFFPKVISDIKLNLIKVIVQDMYTLGLITINEGSFGTMTVSSGFELLTDRLTPAGKSFVGFISLGAR